MFDRTSIVMTVLTGVLLFAAVAPLFAVEIPAMLDYPNHLAGLYLLTGPSNPAYEAHWRVYPDLAMEVIVPALARVMSVATAAKIFLGGSQVLIVTGAVFLEMTVKQRHRLGGLGSLLVVFSLPFAWGQMNFMFGMGLAVWGVSLWIRLRDRPNWIRWIVHAAVVAALFISHFFDLGVYGLIIGAYELSRIGGSPKILTLARLVAFMASPVVLVLVVMAFAGGGIGHVVGVEWDFGLKLLWAFTFMNVYDLPMSILTGGVLLVLVAVLVTTRRLSLTRAGLWIASGLAAAYVGLPRQMFDSQFLDVRLLTAVAIILPAFMTTSLSRGPWRGGALAAIICIIAANEASTARAWFGYQRDYQEFEASFARLESGSAVLIGLRDQIGMSYQPLYYAATLAAPGAGVFVPELYARPGLQPLRPRASYRGLMVTEQHNSVPSSLALLRAAAKPGASPMIPAYLAGWPGRYRYLYLIGAGPDPLPATLTPLFVGRRFDLYRIGPPSPS